MDFGKTAADFARYRAGFPDRLFVRLRALGLGLPAQRLLDVGAGAGALGRGFARQGCTVIALDPAMTLLRTARRLDDESGLRVAYLNAVAEATALAAASFDVVTAGQCWHWFDRPAAAQEARRVLRPGGRLVIAHFDWLPLPGNVVAATEQLILAHNPAWTLAGRRGFYPAWAGDVAGAGFMDIETFTFDEVVTYSHEAWRGRIRASAGVAASLDPTQVQAFDLDLAHLLARQYPQDPLAIPHRVFVLHCRAPRAGIPAGG